VARTRDRSGPSGGRSSGGRPVVQLKELVELSAKQPKSWHESSDLPVPVMEADHVRLFNMGQIPVPAKK
jgi:hypothetical protein